MDSCASRGIVPVKWLGVQRARRPDLFDRLLNETDDVRLTVVQGMTGIFQQTRSEQD